MLNAGTIVQLRADADLALSALRRGGQEVLNNTVKELLQKDGVSVVIWAARSSEYNDEGMYPGIIGPFINPEGFDPEEGIDPFLEEQAYELLYGEHPIDPRAKELEAVLNALGDEIISDIYGDQNMVFAYLLHDGRLQYETEYVGT